jgi:UDP-hydrolysing UDP-N-acetyl-D-glucosamine 2-epimerase
VRTIAAVTVARSDYGILRPVLREIAAQSDLQLTLIVSGTHLSTEFGRTVADIERDGFPVGAAFSTAPDADGTREIATALAQGVSGCAEAYARLHPDLLLLVGDRYEMLAAAAASLPFVIPVAHVHGGELTEGAIDNQIRHAITKMAHLHFVTTPTHARRVHQMGEERWRITVSGAPALDDLHGTPWLTRQEVADRVGLDLAHDPLVVTYHPVTLEPAGAERDVSELVSALAAFEGPVVITAPGADAGFGVVGARLRAWAAERPNTAFVDHLGSRAYWSLLRVAAAMVGNSSSGIIEAASFELPVVNIGTRQAGRERPRNVIQVEATRAAIIAGVQRALSIEFKTSLKGMTNPYGDGRAAARIVRVLRDTPLDERLRVKRFADADTFDPADFED